MTLTEHVFPYLALTILPLSGFLVLNPVAFWWGFRTGSPRVPMPPHIAALSQKVNRYLRLVVFGLILGLLLIFMRFRPADFSLLATTPSDIAIQVLSGCVTGVSLLALKGLILFHSNQYYKSGQKIVLIPQKAVMEGTVQFWLFVFAIGAVIEELWRAYCLIVLLDAGHSIVFAVCMTTLAFTAGHGEWGLGGIIYALLFGSIAAMLFLWLETLIAPVTAHFIANSGLYLWMRTRGRMNSEEG